MTGLHFEWSGAERYPVNLHAGCYTVPMEQEVMEELKGQVNLAPEAFLNLLIQKTTSNDYLKKILQRELENGGDIQKQIEILKNFFKNFKRKSGRR